MKDCFTVSLFRRNRNVQKIQVRCWAGAIGLQIARTIDRGNLSNFDLVHRCRNEKKAAKNLENFDHIPDITA